MLELNNMQKTAKIPNLNNYFNIFKINHRLSSLSEVRSRYYTLLIIKLIMGLWTFVHIYLLGLAFDKLIRLNETKDINGFYWLLGFYMGGHAIASMINVYLGALEDNIVDINDSILQKKALARIITHPLSWHSKQSAGNKYKLIGEGSFASSMLLVEVIEMLTISFNIIISLGYLIWLNPWFIILVSFSIGITLTTNSILQPKIKNIGREISQINEDINGKGFESLNNIYLIKSVDKVTNILKPFNNLIQKILIKSNAKRALINWRFGINSITAITINLSYLIISSNMLLTGVVAFSLVYSGYQYLSRVNNDVIQFSKLLVNATIREIKVNRFLEVFDLNPKQIMSGEKKLSNN
jgi:ABC-type bacteriocin/lantibiotic exporter with double-glycine peptidase domain